MKIDWVTVTVNMHTIAFTHTAYSSSAIPHGLAEHWAQPPRKFFTVYCNARTDWLSPGENKTDPWVIREVGYKGDTISTQCTLDPHSRYDTWETKHILNAPCQPQRILQSKAFLFDMA